MTELFDTGRRILAHGRRLLALPPLAEMPTAYASLLRDPTDLLEELWGGAEHAALSSDEAAAPFGQENERTRLARTGGGAAVEPLSGESQWLLNAPLHVAQTPAAASKSVPLRLTESRPATRPTSALAPLSKDEGYATSSSRQGTAPGLPPPEPSHGVEAPEEGLESYGQKRASSEKPAKVVEWPTMRPASVVGAALATPGNVLQEMEEALGSDPELQRLRGQLEVEEGKRRLRQEWAPQVSEGRPEESRAYANPAGFTTAQTPTSFSPLTPLLSKNVARGDTAADFAPQAPEVVRGGDSLWARGRDEEEERAVVKRTDSEGAGRRADAPLVEEVLEELYERLRLEYSRTYGTTGG